MLVECAKGQRREVRGSRAFVYRESCSRPLEVRQDLGEKKHSRAVDKLEYLPVDVLRSAECRHGSMVFPQVNTVDAHTGEGRTRQSAKTPEKGNRRRRDEKGGCFIYVSLFPTTERKNTFVARLISLILASNARGLKNKYENMEIAIQGYFLKEKNYFPMCVSPIAVFIGCTLMKY